MSCCKVSEGADEMSPKFLCGVIEGFYGRPWTINQRQELFCRMARFGMNTYMYGPKDDYKHRRFWRELYTPEELDDLKKLIQCAESQKIKFVYSLSPGLDLTYCDHDDMTVLKNKLHQIRNLGCGCFALLFDDIDSELCSEDVKVFASFAEAQCKVTNHLYEYLNQPELFLFCPTEYSTSRAEPNLIKSSYLNTVGEKLDKKIDILWTGPKVVSRQIAVEGIEAVNKIVKRPVVIWDNLHANDYDQTRLFLGPYSGRSSDLIGRLRGVLTNPNCEFQSNFIAMHTLAQWSKNVCTRFPGEKVTSNEASGASMTTDDAVAKKSKAMSTGDSAGALIDSNGDSNMIGYDPKRALAFAAADWLLELYRSTSRTTRPDLNPVAAVQSDLSAEDEKSASNKNTRRTTIDEDEDNLAASDVVFLSHFFYLPYSSGPKAAEMMRNARWLLDNVSLIDRSHAALVATREDEREWFDNARHFHKSCNELAAIVDRFSNIPNRELLYEVYRYINDMRCSLALVNSYIKWNAMDSPHKEPFKSGEQEPWVMRGGLLAEFRRLLPLDARNDLPVKNPKYAEHVFTIRPYRPSDKVQVYSVCVKTCDDRMDGFDSLSSSPDVAGDCIIGPFLKYFPQFCFVLEDEHGIVGYIGAADSLKEFNAKVTSDWLPEMRTKYSSEKLEHLQKEALSSKHCISLLEKSIEIVTDELLDSYPSVVTLSVLPMRVSSILTVSRLLHTVTGVLMSKGAHTHVPVRHRAQQEFLAKQDFVPVNNQIPGIQSLITLAKSFE